MKDLMSRLAISAHIARTVLTADNTPTAIDLNGYDAAVLGLHVGAGGITFDGSNKLEVKIFEGDTTVFAAATAVAAKDLNLPDSMTYAAGGIVKSMVAAKAAASYDKVGYVGDKRYIFVLFDFTGTHGTGTSCGVDVILGHPRLAPVAA